MAIAGRMLCPDERIGSDGVQLVIVLGAKRSELDEVALQYRLMIKGHS
jgi:hypothetical protein